MAVWLSICWLSAVAMWLFADSRLLVVAVRLAGCWFLVSCGSFVSWLLVVRCGSVVSLPLAVAVWLAGCWLWQCG